MNKRQAVSGFPPRLSKPVLRRNNNRKILVDPASMNLLHDEIRYSLNQRYTFIICKENFNN